MPDYIYLNIIGFVLIGIYFGIVPSFVFVVVSQILLYSVGLYGEIFGYPLILGIVNMSILGLCLKFIKNRNLSIIFSGVIMALFSKTTANVLNAFFYKTEMLLQYNAETLIRQIKIYIFSVIISLIFVKISEKLFAKEEK